MIESIAHLGLLDDEDILLDIAALELSALDHDGVDLTPFVDKLDEIEADLREADDEHPADGGAAQAAILVQILAGRHGLSGDSESYDAPLNADMIRVIERRRGLPVSLSILYVALARRLGWTAYALNTPGHVLVRVGTGDQSVVIDPFHDGATVDWATLGNLVRRALGSDTRIGAEHLVPMSNRMVLVRLLMNQASRAEQGRDVGRAIAMYQRMVEVAPGHGQGWWNLARLQLADGRIEDARLNLSAMLEVTRDDESRRQIKAALEKLAGR